MNNKTKTRSLRVAIIAIALLLCFALAVGVTSALYQARRQATGTLNMDKGIVIDYKGFNKGDENIWQRETTTSFKLFEETNAQPGQEISVYPSGIRANVDSINFYARLKLEYIFYNVANGVETKVDLPNPKSLIKTSNDFFASKWVASTDGYYYFGENTTLNQFSKDNQNFENLFADGAKFIIEGANFEGETAGEGGGFVVNGTAINKIVVYLTLETLQGDADPAVEGWKISQSTDKTVDISTLPEDKTDITIDDIIDEDNKNGEITITGDPKQPLTITIGSKAFYGCSKLKLTLSNSENIEYRIATDAFSSGATIMYGIDNVSSKLINPSTSGHTTVGFDGKWQVSVPGLYLFLPSPITPTTSSYGDFQYTDDQGTWYFDLVDEKGNKVDASTLSSIMSTNSVSTLGASTYANTDNYTAKLNKFIPKDGVTTVVIPKYLGISEDSNKFALTKIDSYDNSGSSGAFYNLNNITSIIIPNSVTSIGDYAFCGSGLTSITIPDNVTSIGNSAFKICWGLTSITIPDGVTSIGDYAFQFCSGLTSITIPNGVTSIGREAFYSCSGLTSITIPNNVTSIGDSAFAGCYSVTSITIPNSVTSIGGRAFEGCRIISITIPNSVTSIGSGAFSSCSGLTSINIGAGISEVSWLPDNVSSMTITILENNPYLATDSKAIFAKSDNRLSLQKYISADTTYEIPAKLNGLTVTSIGISAFRSCSSLTSITIPDSVTSIGSGAFSSCSGLTSITIPDSVTSIGDYAFSDCSGLTSIIFSERIKEIPRLCFSGCSGLTSITIPEGVSSIRERAFSDCSSLSSITLPSSLYIIGGESHSSEENECAFSGCSSLTSITIPDGVSIISEFTFLNCTNLKTIKIGANVRNTEWFESSMENIEISSKNPYLATDSKAIFAKSNGELSVSKYISADTTYEIPAKLNGLSVTSIGDRAFSGSSLTSITIPDSVTSIGSSAFSSCSSLTSITIPNSVTSIGWEAFDGCSGLTSITIPDSVTSIGDHAFAGCSGLKSIVLPEGIKEIPWQCFKNCTNLESVTIPSTCTTIGNSAFENCSNLTTVIWNVSYDLGGVNATGPELSSYTGSQTSGLTMDDVIKSAPTNVESGFTFEGWSDGTNIYQPGEKITFSLANRRLTAVWSNCRVTFDANGGTGSVDSQIVSKGSSITLPSLDSFTREGYVALGWSTNKNANSASYSAGASYTPTSNVTLYVVWKKPVTITFDANGGTGNIPNIITSDGGQLKIPTETPTREGYRFLGWAWSSTATYADYSVGSTSTYTYYASNGTTLYAVWKELVTITLDANGGTGSGSYRFTSNNDSFCLTNYSNNFTAPDGYALAGWSTNASAETAEYGIDSWIYAYNFDNDTTLYAVWKKLATITFDLDGGEGILPQPIRVAQGNNVFVNTGSDFTKSGYKFAGWDLYDENGEFLARYYNGSNFTFNYSGLSYTFKAMWDSETTVTFYNDDTKSQSFTKTGYLYADGLQMPDGQNIITKEGYILVGWATSPNSTYVPYSVGSIVKGSYTEFYAVWKTESECAKIILDLSEVEGQQNIEYIGYSGNYNFPDLSDLRNAAGQKIIGWSRTQGSSSPTWSSGSQIWLGDYTGSTLTLYPVWKTLYKLTFDLNGGVGDIPTMDIEAYEWVNIPETKPTKDGYMFKGWAWDANSSYADYNAGDSCYINSESDKTLYALWAERIIISFDANGGTGDVPSSIETYDQGRFDIPEVSLTKDGYMFAGWAWRADYDGTEYRNGQKDCYFSINNSNGSTTLYAMWRSPLTIKFDLNGGEGTVPADITTYYQGRVDIPKVTLTKEGYTFLGWDYNANKSGWAYIEYQNGETNRTYYEQTSKTLYAIWGAPVNITFDLNGGEGTIPENITGINYGDQFTIPSVTLTRLGYNFIGWSRRQNANGDYDWSNGTTTSSRFISGNFTIYAQWEVLNNEVFVGSLTQAEIDAVQALWNGHTRLSELTNTSLLSSMSNNKLHSRFNILGYLNNTSLKSNTTGNSSYGISWSTRYYKLSTNTYTFEFENSLPTGWMLVNWRYEVKASGDVTIVNGRAKATIDYTYVDLSSADQSDNLMILFVLPNQPAESESVSVSISSLPGNALEAVLKGTGNEALNNLMLSGITVEIYNADGSLIWTGKPNDSNQGFVKYRFATETYKIRFYTTNVNGVAFVDNDKGTEVTGMDISAITKGDGYSEFTINYTFAEGNPNLAIIFKMADVDVDKIMEVSAEKELSGPRNIVGNWFKGMFANMGVAFTDMTADEIKYAGYCGMLIQEYFNRSICNLPSFSIYTSDGKFVENCEYMALIAGVEYTIKFTEEVKELLIAGNDTMTIKSITDITYNAETGTWDTTFNVFDTEGSILMFFTADLDLSQYEDLPAYDANTDYSQYLEMH